MRPSRRSVTIFAATLLAATACHKKPEPAPVPASPPSAPRAAAPRVNQDSIDAARRAADAAARAAADAEARRHAGETASLKATLAARIFFDYDKSEIRADQIESLDAKAGILTANPALRLRIEGNTDDRGSDEYNLALGQRRAAAALRYFVSRGIDASRFETVSFGKERPAAQGENDAAWAQNRRDEFVIIAGGDNLRAPR